MEGTPFDFRTPTPIGARIDADNEQVRVGQGCDPNFVLRPVEANRNDLRFAAPVVEPQSGRVLAVHTTEPGLQFDSGSLLDGAFAGKDGAVYDGFAGVCLDPQHVPDSPDPSAFSSTILRPGETYRSRTVFSFGTGRREDAAPE